MIVELPLDEIPLNGVRLASVQRREIAVVRTAAEIFAVRNLCPHQAGPLGSGLVMAKIVASSVGENIDVEGDGVMITCPWHGWEFDLSSGRCLTDPAMRVATYPVEVAERLVRIDVTS